MVVDGGMSINDFVMQVQADLSGIVVERKKEKELTALGAAVAAGLKSGFFTNLE